MISLAQIIKHSSSLLIITLLVPFIIIALEELVVIGVHEGLICFYFRTFSQRILGRLLDKKEKQKMCSLIS